jgi:S-adenosylmethionine-diacylgycerolhomoserine-N-methlytransferase
MLAALKTLYHLSVSPIRGDDHAQRLESFYRGQANDYDAFRKRLLHGRRSLIERLPMRAGDVWTDIGCGTGENLELAGPRLQDAGRVCLVDLCPSLLSVARDRVRAKGWKNVEVVQADAEQYRPPAESVDLVTCSYSLSMIPDWIAVLENIRAMLRPGGHIGVVDFYVSRKYPPAGCVCHSWWTRTFWPTWFALDNVSLRSDLLPLLTRCFRAEHLEEARGKVPFLCGVRAPYFVFVGQKGA